MSAAEYLEPRLLASFELPLITGLGREFWESSGQSAPWSERAFLQSFTTGIRNGSRFVIVAEARGVGIVAGLGCAVGRSDFTGELLASEAFYYAARDHRGRFGNLLKAAEAEAKKRGAKKFWMIHLENERAEAMSRWYQRAGFKPMERLYEKAI